jgi:hypothetical protein
LDFSRISLMGDVAMRDLGNVLDYVE